MPKSSIKLAIVGVGKIVKDQHLPSIEKVGAYELVATASRNGRVEGVKAYQNISAMLQAESEIQAVSLCMPPQYRFSAAQTALNHGVDVLLEKPPGATVCEVEQLEQLASEKSSQLYTTWHSRHGAAVPTAKAFLARGDVEIESVKITWKEDVRKWHPGQDWIWQAGGLGVFDPGINGLSILTDVLPQAFFVERAELFFPENKAAPIAANIDFRGVAGQAIVGEFDWRVSGDEHWTIEVLTNQGLIKIAHGGGQLEIDGQIQEVPAHSEHGEYESIYAEFAQLVTNRQSAVDIQPLKLAADAFLLGQRQIVEAFIE